MMSMDGSVSFHDFTTNLVTLAKDPKALATLEVVYMNLHTHILHMYIYIYIHMYIYIYYCI